MCSHPGSPLVLLPCWLWQCLAYMLHLINTHRNSAPPPSLLGVCSGHVQNRDGAKYYSSALTHAQSGQIACIFWSKRKFQNAITSLVNQDWTTWIKRRSYVCCWWLESRLRISTSTLFMVFWENLGDSGMYTKLHLLFWLMSKHTYTTPRRQACFHNQLVFML